MVLAAETDSCLDSSCFCDSDIEDEIYETCSSSTYSSEPSAMLTVFNSLRAPKPSELARKRSSRVNPPPPKGKQRSSCRGHSDPKTIILLQRVNENVDEELCVANGKLFCNAFREEVSLKSKTI